MITLKLNEYQTNEALALQNLLELALEKQKIRSNCDEDCKNCPYTHLCYDLEHAIEYLDRYIDGRDGE